MRKQEFARALMENQDYTFVAGEFFRYVVVGRFIFSERVVSDAFET